MNECNKCRELSINYKYEELNPEQKKFLKNHLNICKKCKSEYKEIESTLKIMNQRVRPEPGKVFWDGYWDRLAKRMENESVTDSQPESWWRNFRRNLSSSPRWAYQTAAALLLIVMGIFIGRMIYTPSAPEFQRAQQTAPAASHPELIQRTQNYLDRSKLILLALTNFDPETEDPFALNLPLQKKVSRELVNEAGVLKRELTDAKERRLQELVADLEVILLQIANLELENDLEAIDIVKNGVDSRGILMKINLSDIRQSTNEGKKKTPVRQLNKV